MKLNQTASPVRAIANDAGFTLLEIIAVLVILGILAVVAVPRYFDLQANAQARAMQAGEAEVRGRINSHFAQQVLGGTAPTAIEYTIATIAPASGGLAIGDIGDFQITDMSGGTSPSVTISVTISGDADTAIAGLTSSFTVPRPGAP